MTHKQNGADSATIYTFDTNVTGRAIYFPSLPGKEEIEEFYGANHDFGSPRSGFTTKKGDCDISEIKVDKFIGASKAGMSKDWPAGQMRPLIKF